MAYTPKSWKNKGEPGAVPVYADDANNWEIQIAQGQLLAEAAQDTANEALAAFENLDVTEAVDDAIAGMDVTTAADFEGEEGLYDFPGSSGASLVTQEIDGANYLSGSALEGQHTTVGDTEIIVKPDAAPAGVWTVNGSGEMYCTAGGATTPMYVDVGSPEGISTAVVGALNSIGSAQGIGAFIAGRILTGDARMMRWGIATATRYYTLARSSGTTLPGTVVTLATSSVVAQPGDVVDLEYRDHVLRLYVNGTLALSYTLTSGEQASYGLPNATLAGVHANSTVSGATIASWSYATGWPTVDRKMIAIGSDHKLPESVEMSDAMIAEINARTAGARRFSIVDYGAAMDAVLLTDAVTAAGLPTVSSSARPFTSADVGKTIAVMGAGPVVANANDGVWISTVTSVSSGVATLTSNATSTVSGARCIFGTPDDAAFAAAQDAAVSAGGGTVFIPPGRTIVTVPLNVQNYVSWAGAGRELSWVHVVADRPGSGSTAGTSDWLTCAGRTSANLLIGADFRDFGVQAEAMIHTAGYGSAIKPLNIYYVKRCSIERMNVWNTPATAVPFDHSYEMCVIRDNVIVNPGRLAPSGVGPGGSGIGAGTRGAGSVEPTLIENNVIIGTHTAGAAGPGHNGIFTEGQTGADPDEGVVGYRIRGNVVIGMPFGISDTGSTGTLIDGNTIIGCGRGIRLSRTSLDGSYPGLHTIIRGNTIRGSVGPATFDGIGIAITTADGPNVRAEVHTIIEGNQVIECDKWGIWARATSGATDLDGIMIHGNVVRANGRSGIRMESTGTQVLNYPAIKDNQIVGNGRAAVAGEVSGILIPSGTTIVGGRIQDNDIYDLASSPTQTATITSTGATLTGVRVAGNTGDA